MVQRARLAPEDPDARQADERTDRDVGGLDRIAGTAQCHARGKTLLAVLRGRAVAEPCDRTRDPIDSRDPWD